MTENQRIELRREMGRLGYAFLWLIGRPLVEQDKPKPGLSFYTPVHYWKVNVCHDTWVYTRYAPNAFHRGMQRLAFGVRWFCMV